MEIICFLEFVSELPKKLKKFREIMIKFKSIKFFEIRILIRNSVGKKLNEDKSCFALVEYKNSSSATKYSIFLTECVSINQGNICFCLDRKTLFDV